MTTLFNGTPHGSLFRVVSLMRSLMPKCGQIHLDQSWWIAGHLQTAPFHANLRISDEGQRSGSNQNSRE